MFIETADRGPVHWLTLNQPDHKNAIPAAGWGELREALTQFEKSGQRALVPPVASAARHGRITLFLGLDNAIPAGSRIATKDVEVKM